MKPSTSAIRKGLSLGKVAEYCGVTRKTILRWVQDGMIQGFTLPSGHHRVLPRDLAHFLDENNMPVPDKLKKLCRNDQPRALVVDDEENIRHIVRDLLAPQFAVSEASNGVEACVKMGAETPDLLILDIRMPDMDGISVVERVRRMPQLAEMKIIIASAYINADVRERLGDMVDAFLPKPFQSRSLLNLCQNVLDKARVGG